MNGRRYLAVAILCLLAVTVALAQTPADPLAYVKRLYATASNDVALAAPGGHWSR